MRPDARRAARIGALAGFWLFVLASPQPLDAGTTIQGSIIKIKRLSANDLTRKPRKVTKETSFVQICTNRNISEQPPIAGNCKPAGAGDDLLWGEGLRVEKLRRARVLLPLTGIEEPFVFLPRLFGASGAQVWPEGGAADVPRGEYKLSEDGHVLDIVSGSLIALDHDAAALKRAGLVVRVSGGAVQSEHTTWFLGVGGTGEATLVVDSGEVVITADTLAADSLRASWATPGFSLSVPQGSTATWSMTRAPTVTVTGNPLMWREAILYNGDDIWDDGRFPWIVVPAVAVPVILCIILCGGDDDGGGKTGTVTIPIP